jgi:NAD(P)H dehydrogenase (quinone)
MTTAVIGATGHIGGEIVRGLLARGDAVAALVRDHDEASRAFGEPDGLHIRPTGLDDPRDVTKAFRGIRTVFIAMGSIDIQGVLQRIAINAAAGISSIEQVTRVSVLNTSADSLGINQRAHYSIDQFASSTGVAYSTIRPAIFSLSLLAAAGEVRASRTWTGLQTAAAGLDRPSRRGRGRAARPYGQGTVGRPSRCNGAGRPVVARGARRTFDGTR